MTAAEDRTLDLLEYAIARPHGFTIGECCDDLGWGRIQFTSAVHDLRAFLGETDEMALPCNPQGGGEQWLYRLVGTLDDARGWVTNRVGDSETRIRTIQSTMRSIVRATNGRTIEGKRARLIETGLRHLIEDLDNLTV